MWKLLGHLIMKIIQENCGIDKVVREQRMREKEFLFKTFLGTNTKHNSSSKKLASANK